MEERVLQLEAEVARLKRVVESVCLPMVVQMAAAADPRPAELLPPESELPSLLSRMRTIASDLWHSAIVKGPAVSFQDHIAYVDCSQPCQSGGTNLLISVHCANSVQATVVRRDLLPPKATGCIRIIACSDTHEKHRDLGLLPSGDLFVHSGDILWLAKFRPVGSQLAKLQDFNAWLGEIKCANKVVVAGNHDHVLEQIGRDKAKAVLSNAHYLENEWVDVAGVRVFGTPFSVQGHMLSPNLAFQSQAFAAEADAAARGCASADILVSHGPNPEIARTLQPAAHLWGHYHYAYGVIRGSPTVVDVDGKDTFDMVQRKLAAAGALGNPASPAVSVCSATLNRKQKVANLPVVIDLPRPTWTQAKL